MNRVTSFLIIYFLFSELLISSPKTNNLLSVPTVDGAATTFSSDLEASLDTLTQEFHYSTLIILFSVTLITILIVLTFSLLKLNKIRAKSNFLLQQKNSELILAKEKAEKANKIKTQFLSNITHELRTPLYAVTGLTHLLLEENPTPNQKDHLNSLRFSGEYLLSLINNILDLNKLEANKVEVEVSSFNLKKRISDVLIALNKAANDRNNKVNLIYESTIPKRIKGDSLKISQILINLVGNAIKFTKDGTITIRVKAVDNFEKKGKIRLNFEIEDDGLGISEDRQEIIFDNFSQESQQVNRVYGGSGLGLSIVKNLLVLLGSDIKLESTVGKGSRFFFDLDFELVSEIDLSEKKKVLSEIDFEIFKSKKILIVEDNKINQLITRKIIEKQEVICDVADNGDMAIEKARNNKYDLILMDIHMPGISGVEASKIIREFDKKTPIIALTAVTLDDHIEEFYVNGITDVIPKPYKTEEFYEKVNKAFSGKYKMDALSIEK